jgi:hypothetical protein
MRRTAGGPEYVSAHERSTPRPLCLHSDPKTGSGYEVGGQSAGVRAGERARVPAL